MKLSKEESQKLQRWLPHDYIPQVQKLLKHKKKYINDQMIEKVVRGECEDHDSITMFTTLIAANEKYRQSLINKE